MVTLSPLRLSVRCCCCCDNVVIEDDDRPLLRDLARCSDDELGPCLVGTDNNMGSEEDPCCCCLGGGGGYNCERSNSSGVYIRSFPIILG